MSPIPLGIPDIQLQENRDFCLCCVHFVFVFFFSAESPVPRVLDPQYLECCLVYSSQKIIEWINEWLNVQNLWHCIFFFIPETLCYSQCIAKCFFFFFSMLVSVMRNLRNYLNNLIKDPHLASIIQLHQIKSLLVHFFRNYKFKQRTRARKFVGKTIFNQCLF